MNVKWKLFLRNLQKELMKKWYRSVKPIANCLANREEKKYKDC